ncbi:endopeptidase La [Nannocystis bainbridge]|uniref:Lon protease n=1 Tax=Nannocystis bainbridge TaxID=2995303 RepID=A0ABT5EAG5_9BACT|nr:endopeptidase La [Nannocystis bainbridge]MDC0721862.1 endopeptidase La [Nannocystis bainbridge]
MSHPEYPSVIPLLPLRNGVLFPGTVITVPVGRARSIAMIEAVGQDAIVGIAVQRDARMVDPELADLQPIGTYARVRQVRRTGERNYQVVLEGLGRFSLKTILHGKPYWTAEVEHLLDENPDPTEAKLLATALGSRMREKLQEIAPDMSSSFGQWIELLGRGDDPGLLADRVAAALSLDTDKEVQVLLTRDVSERLRVVSRLLDEAITLAELKHKIDSEVRRGLHSNQREVLLRQQLRAIQKELGEEPKSDDLQALRQRLDDAGLPEEARKVADRELARLEAMNNAHAEFGVIRTYLEWIADLPWNKRASGMLEIDAIAKKLDADHFGLEEVKKRILEHMAVLKVSGNTRATLLCLAGPPGVGKTSLGQSIADATGRPFVRIALGGVRDEAEIRGHRRTYVGALPGRLLHALKKAGKKNAVVLLDEIDKLGNSWMGSPDAALLEVLDPEQNKTFTDHYLELPFDLSEVLFICTANSLDTISAPLRDRLEVIELSGYTLEEKLHIAKDHLLPKQIKDHAIAAGTMTVTDDAVKTVIREYTREAGVRQLGRELTKLCRALTLEIARADEGKSPRLHIDAGELHKYLGKPRFQSEVAERTAVPGVATGLAWTPVGGDILFVETSRMPGKGSLEITGQLGDVMKESARAALTYVRSNAGQLGVDVNFLDRQDLHIHVPAGAVPKDGPSAGVTMFTALTSLLTGRRVRNDTAMTGECTLRGRVLPVGGIKSKVLAAHRAGIKRVVLPHRNARDIEDVPEDVRQQVEFIFAEDMRQVLDAALEPVVLPPESLAADSPRAEA